MQELNGASRDESLLVEAILTASRALVAIAARSLGEVGQDITLPQYRTLVLLASRGPTKLADLATALGVHPATATRMCDRLLRKGLIERKSHSGDRRQVEITLTVSGIALLAQVSRLRRAEIAAIAAKLPNEVLDALISTLVSFSDAAGEIPDRDWSSGWPI